MEVELLLVGTAAPIGVVRRTKDLTLATVREHALRALRASGAVRTAVVARLHRMVELGFRWPVKVREQLRTDLGVALPVFEETAAPDRRHQRSLKTKPADVYRNDTYADVLLWTPAFSRIRDDAGVRACARVFVQPRFFVGGELKLRSSTTVLRGAGKLDGRFAIVRSSPYEAALLDCQWNCLWPLASDSTFTHGVVLGNTIEDAVLCTTGIDITFYKLGSRAAVCRWVGFCVNTDPVVLGPFAFRIHTKRDGDCDVQFCAATATVKGDWRDCVDGADQWKGVPLKHVTAIVRLDAETIAVAGRYKYLYVFRFGGGGAWVLQRRFFMWKNPIDYSSGVHDLRARDGIVYGIATRRSTWFAIDTATGASWGGAACSTVGFVANTPKVTVGFFFWGGVRTLDPGRHATTEEERRAAASAVAKTKVYFKARGGGMALRSDETHHRLVQSV